MALGNNQRNGGYTSLSVRTSTDDKGRKRAVIAKRCTKDAPGARIVTKADGMPALDKEGNNVYRLEFDYIEGRIVKLEKRTSDYGDFLDVMIHDDEVYMLSLGRGDRYWGDFMQRLLNVDPSKPVRLTPYNIEDDGKYNQGISMVQNGQKVTRKWTKENNYEGGPPQAEYDEFEKQWRFGKRNAWLEANVLDVFVTKLGAVPVAGPVAAQVDDDDLPF